MKIYNKNIKNILLQSTWESYLHLLASIDGVFVQDQVHLSPYVI